MFHHSGQKWYRLRPGNTGGAQCAGLDLQRDAPRARPRTRPARADRSLVTVLPTQPVLGPNVAMTMAPARSYSRYRRRRRLAPVRGGPLAQSAPSLIADHAASRGERLTNSRYHAAVTPGSSRMWPRDAGFRVPRRTMPPAGRLGYEPGQARRAANERDAAFDGAAGAAASNDSETLAAAAC